MGIFSRDFPFPSGGPSATLKDDNDVTFDPLAVAAVLSNPRADLSAARLYLQLDRKNYRWPHTMMIGGTLPPMNTLVAHLSMNVTSIHPAITMCGIDIKLIPVRSDMIFKEFPINQSNYRLNDLVEFRSSQIAGNDFMVINMDDLDDKARRKHKLGMGSWPGRIALQVIGFANGLLLLTGVAFSALTADVWAGTLFFFYALHWVASTFITFSEMIRTNVKGSIVPDQNLRYAVYQRPEGGTVIFKGKKETLERWARETMEFNKKTRVIFFHWFWMISGTMAAVSSVACMVNMRGYMQLGFLAVLVYSSVAEIAATQISRRLQAASRGEFSHQLVDNNITRTKGIIRGTIENYPKCRLKGLNWIALELLPNWPLYQEMQQMLARINELQEEDEKNGGVDMEVEVDKAITQFLAETTKPGTDPAKILLANRISDETRAAWAAASGGEVDEKSKAPIKLATANV
ncbi:hypothetical protein TWF730_008695 [Orbilia blumenaviensis]|uniref:Uncharacterized protein n=1 Tax=Orbilia blumenaviensis TaxID=1796055 RepID=A0AAV9V6B0_9PEZI